MKRGLRWIDGEDDDTSSSGNTSNLDSDSEDNNNKGSTKENTGQSSKLKSSQVGAANKKKKGIDFEALSRHGYKGGLSVLNMSAPKELEREPEWSWSKGKEKKPNEKEEESFEERQRTRAAISDGEQLLNVRTHKERKNNPSFLQKEKRKRDLGQASRGKNYVEEEKRLLRDSGVYSGFDS